MDKEFFSPVQIEQLRLVIAEVLRAELANVGLRVDSGDQIDEARKDMGFLRWMRQAGNRMAQRLGYAMIAIFVSGTLYIANLGFQAYLAMHGKPPGG